MERVWVAVVAVVCAVGMAGAALVLYYLLRGRGGGD
jgi:hypothetical protein